MLNRRRRRLPVGYEARFAAGQPERGVRNISRKPGSAQRHPFGQPWLRNLGYPLDQICRHVRIYLSPDIGGHFARAYGVDSNPALCKFQRHRFR